MTITGTILIETKIIHGYTVHAVYETPRKLWAFCPTIEQANLIKALLDTKKYKDLHNEENFDTQFNNSWKNSERNCTYCGWSINDRAPFSCPHPDNHVR